VISDMPIVVTLFSPYIQVTTSQRGDRLGISYLKPDLADIRTGNLVNCDQVYKLQLTLNSAVRFRFQRSQVIM
jgi:hypothetical protein